MISSYNKHKISVFGETYNLISDEAEEHVLEAGILVDTVMRDIAEKTQSTDIKKIAVLAALRYASNALHLQKQLDRYMHEQSKLVTIIDSEFEALL